MIIDTTTIDKDITINLLELLGFNYYLVGKNKKGIIQKIFNLIKTNVNIYRISKDFKPDIMLGVAGINISQVSIPSIQKMRFFFTSILLQKS